MKANEFFNDMRKTARAWDKTSDFPYTSGAMKASARQALRLLW